MRHTQLLTPTRWSCSRSPSTPAAASRSHRRTHVTATSLLLLLLVRELNSHLADERAHIGSNIPNDNTPHNHTNYLHFTDRMSSCIPCHSVDASHAIPDDVAARRCADELSSRWSVESGKLRMRFDAETFVTAIDFFNAVATVAEKHGVRWL